MIDKIMEILLSAVSTSPLLAALFWWGWSERSERQNLQSKYEQLVARVEKGLSDSTHAVKTITSSQESAITLLDSMKNLLLVRIGGPGWGDENRG